MNHLIIFLIGMNNISYNSFKEVVNRHYLYWCSFKKVVVFRALVAPKGGAEN